MILIDDIYDEKEEISEVTTIPKTPHPQTRVRNQAPSEPLLPVAENYGTFGSKRHPARRKIWKAFFVDCGVWIVVVCLVIGYQFFLRQSSKHGSATESTPRTKKPITYHPDETRIRTPSCVYATPVLLDPRASESIIFMNDDRPNKAAANFSIPVTSNLVHFFNNGSVNRAFGFIRISVSEERRPDIQVDVTISYENEDQLKTARLCLVEEIAGEMGVGILFPTSDLTRDDEKQVRFDFDVILPAPLDETESELFLKKLKTNFTVVHHRLDDFTDKVKFESVSLQTTFMPISISALYAEEVVLRSKDSLFVGSIRANKSVDLQTSNSPISVDITLTNNDTKRPSQAILKTSNSPIDASIRLFSDVGGVFFVDAETENAHLGLYNNALPRHSTLIMKGRTSRAPVTILAPPQFEGTFHFSSKQSPPFIEPRHVEDPEGRGRERRIYVAPTLVGDRVAHGRVWWDDGRDQLSGSETQLNSSIMAETTVNPIFFKLYHVEG